MPSATAQRLLPWLCCCPSSLFPVAVAHLGGRSEPSPCARTAFRLPGLEKVPQEREVYHPHRGDRWRGLSWRGPDPVTVSAPCQQEAPPTHHSFIHFGASPCLPKTAGVRLFQPQGCGGMRDGSITSLGPGPRLQRRLPRCLTALSVAPAQTQRSMLAPSIPDTKELQHLHKGFPTPSHGLGARLT